MLCILQIMASGSRAPSGAEHEISPSRFGNRAGITERVFGRKARAVIDVAGLIPLAAPGGCVLFFTANLGKIPKYLNSLSRYTLISAFSPSRSRLTSSIGAITVSR